MKPITFRNRLNGQVVVCENVRDVEVIDNEEYLKVHHPGQARQFLMRRGALEKVKQESIVKSSR